MSRITNKLILTFVVILALGLLLLGYVMNVVITNQFLANQQEGLKRRALTYTRILSEDYSEQTIKHVVAMETAGKQYVSILGVQNERLGSSKNVEESVENQALQRVKRKQVEGELPSFKVNGREYFGYVTFFDIQGEGQGKLVLLSEPILLLETLKSIQTTLILAGVGSLSVVTALTIILSNQVTRPILKLKKLTQLLAKGDYHARVPVQSRDEIGLLAQSINQLAENLEHYRTSRKKFLSDISHELRTPITYIKGYASLLMDKKVKPFKQQQLFEIISSEAERLEHLVEDLVTLSRLDEGRVQLQLEEVDLKSLLEKVANRIQSYAEREGYHLSLELEHVRIKGDPRRLTQVLMNLMENAIRYSGREKRIELRLYRHGWQAVIEVEDHGHGISGKELPYIWERFYRVEKSRSRQFGGSGLGLPISRELVELHGGSIDVQSHAGKGTVFRIYLPLLEGGHQK